MRVGAKRSGSSSVVTKRKVSTPTSKLEPLDNPPSAPPATSSQRIPAPTTRRQLKPVSSTASKAPMRATAGAANPSASSTEKQFQRFKQNMAQQDQRSTRGALQQQQAGNKPDSAPVTSKTRLMGSLKTSKAEAEPEPAPLNPKTGFDDISSPTAGSSPQISAAAAMVLGLGTTPKKKEEDKERTPAKEPTPAKSVAKEATSVAKKPASVSQPPPASSTSTPKKSTTASASSHLTTPPQAAKAPSKPSAPAAKSVSPAQQRRQQQLLMDSWPKPTAEVTKIMDGNMMEKAFSGEFTRTAHESGYFACARCATPLFDYSSKVLVEGGYAAFQRGNVKAMRVELQFMDDGEGTAFLIRCRKCNCFVGKLTQETINAKTTSGEIIRTNSVSIRHVDMHYRGKDRTFDIDGEDGSSDVAASSEEVDEDDLDGLTREEYEDQQRRISEWGTKKLVDLSPATKRALADEESEESEEDESSDEGDYSEDD